MGKIANKGQSLAEYAIVIAVISAVFFAMQSYMKRGIQQGIRLGADELSGGAQVTSLSERMATRSGSITEIGEAGKNNPNSRISQFTNGVHTETVSEITRVTPALDNEGEIVTSITERW